MRRLYFMSILMALFSLNTVAYAFNNGMSYGAGRNLMTFEERLGMRQQMQNVKTYDECIGVQTEHRAKMILRAKEKGLPEPVFKNRCDSMQERGRFKN